MKKRIYILAIAASLLCQSVFAQTKTLYANNPNPRATLIDWINDESVSDILIKPGTYNLQGTLAVNRSNNLRIRGTTWGYNGASNTPGTQSIETTLSNTRFRFDNRASHLTFQNLKITADTAGSVLIYDDAELGREGKVDIINVHIEGGLYSIMGRAGFGGLIKHTTMNNFAFIGILFDRHSQERTAEYIVIDRSKFAPDTRSGSLSWENRSVSFDAGNSEFPYVWDFQGSKIIGSHFVNSGFACSRCKNMTISDNTFTYSDGVAGIQSMEAIHLEEFSSNFEIHNNKFEFNNSKGRGIYLDLELQTAHDVTITGSKVHGEYGSFFMAESAQNVTIRDTVLGPTAKGTHFVNNQSSFHHRGENLEWKIQVRGDIDLDIPYNYNAATHGKITEGFSEDKLLDPDFLPEAGDYYIENIQTGQRIYADWQSKELKLGSSSATSANYQWKLTKVHSPHRFFNFTVNSVGMPDVFWEVDQGFTAAHFQSDTFPVLKVKNYTYADGEIYSGHLNAPSWVIRKAQHETESNAYYFHPGGNERRARIGYTDNELTLKPAMQYDNENKLKYMDWMFGHQSHKWRLVPVK
ncbi:right-handed parallel beta-helix repeat-containing protein [Vibrio sp. WXL103]|uniref:right-handed parallel beta-helix repeat-containing protein n=1 Tax=Vibrio sp. WXL103 TaxID=3450710 RepID=UPI003EC7C2B9